MDKRSAESRELVRRSMNFANESSFYVFVQGLMKNKVNNDLTLREHLLIEACKISNLEFIDTLWIDGQISMIAVNRCIEEGYNNIKVWRHLIRMNIRDYDILQLILDFVADETDHKANLELLEFLNDHSRYHLELALNSLLDNLEIIKWSYQKGIFDHRQILDTLYEKEDGIDVEIFKFIHEVAGISFQGDHHVEIIHAARTSCTVALKYFKDIGIDLSFDKNILMTVASYSSKPFNTIVFLHENGVALEPIEFIYKRAIELEHFLLVKYLTNNGFNPGVNELIPLLTRTMTSETKRIVTFLLCRLKKQDIRTLIYMIYMSYEMRILNHTDNLKFLISWIKRPTIHSITDGQNLSKWIEELSTEGKFDKSQRYIKCDGGHCFEPDIIYATKNNCCCMCRQPFTNILYVNDDEKEDIIDIDAIYEMCKSSLTAKALELSD